MNRWLNKSQLRFSLREWLLFTALIAVTIALVVTLQRYESAERMTSALKLELKQKLTPTVDDSSGDDSIRIQYNRYLLLRTTDHVFALHITPDDEHAFIGIIYSVIQLPRSHVFVAKLDAHLHSL